MPNGRILKVNGGFYTVLLEDKSVVVTKASGKLRYLKVDKDSSFNKTTTLRTKVDTKYIKLSPKAGDEVVLDENNSIISVLERKNELDRPFLANVDQIFLVSSLKKPEMSFTLLDRFICNLENKGIKLCLLFTKIDLVNEEELQNFKEKISYYERIGYDAYYVNSLEKGDLAKIKEVLKEKVSVFAGQTGAGKSSFLNSLIPDFTLKTQEISEALGRGKHTTRTTELYQAFDGLIADTPGFSSIEFLPMHAEDLKDFFIEFKTYTCRFRDCRHIDEPGCGIIEAVSSKKILSTRYESYASFYKEIKNVKKKF